MSNIEWVSFTLLILITIGCGMLLAYRSGYTDGHRDGLRIGRALSRHASARHD
jgi:hypothetical protein